MRVLHVLQTVTSDVLAGYTIRSDSILNAQKKLGLNPSVLVIRFNDRSAANRLTKNYVMGIPYYYFKGFLIWGLLRKLVYIFNFLDKTPIFEKILFQNKVETILRDTKADVVHVASPALNFITLHKLIGQKLPFVYEARGVWEDSRVANGQIKYMGRMYKYQRGLEDKALRFANAVVTISKSLKKDFVKRGIDGKKIFVLENGANLEKFFPSRKKTSLQKKFDIESSVVLGYITSVRRLEGLDYLIKSLPLIKQSTTNKVKVLIVGEGPDIARLKKLIKILKLEKEVIMTGRIEHKEINDYYNLIDIFVVPRLNQRVNRLVTPLKPYEAMACAKPLLVSNLPALEEIVENGKTGVTFEAEDLRDLAEKAVELIDNPILRELYGNAGRDKVIRESSWDMLAKKYADVYKFAQDSFKVLDS